ncbi:MAG: helix-turn-helix transcriptional regulator [Bacteroidetes bacterium]|nr:helix-turn-helix transcriptional regulator [Bacteroidota bacterium]
MLETNALFEYVGTADTCPELIFSFKGNASSVLIGQSSTTRHFHIDGGVGMIGIVFQPGALYRLTGIPGYLFNNKCQDPQEIFGKRGKEIDGKIANAVDTGERIQLLSDFVLQQQSLLNKDDTFLTSASLLEENPWCANLAVLASSLHLSPRQFERRFKTSTGMSPILFSRIARFKKSLLQAEEKLSDIAYNCGYFDQSHFIRDFKQFYGLRPNQYFSGKIAGAELISSRPA